MQEKIYTLIDQLTGDVPPDPADRTPEQHARWLLAHSLDWHRREQKALWWEYFRLSDLAAEDLLDERAGLSGLSSSAQPAEPPRRQSTATAFRRRRRNCAAAKASETWAVPNSARSRRYRWTNAGLISKSAATQPMFTARPFSATR